MLSLLKKNTLSTIIAVIVLIALFVSGILYLSGLEALASQILKWVLLCGSIPLWYGIIRDMVLGKFGVDLIAGVALIATFTFGENLAGVVVLLMLSGGQTLEEYALMRARRDLSALLSRAPHFAHVKKDGVLQDIPIEDVLVDAIVTIKPGEVVPVDGVVVLGKTLIDESTLTGESVLVEKHIGTLVYSGTVNTNTTVDVRVTKPAKESKYSHIIELIKEAEKQRAPLVRLADRYSVYFTLITFLIAFATWIFTHNITAVLAVLVVATPCPLILATPIALISGMSRAAGRGVIVKGGGSLEKISEAKTFVFDKTGTVTLGTPVIESVFAYKGMSNEVIRIAGSLDQLSAHVLASSVVSYAHTQNVELVIPSQFEEKFGDGVWGIIENKNYFLGKYSFVLSKTKKIPTDIEYTYAAFQDEGKSVIFLADEKELLGYIVMVDTLRSDSRLLFDGLKLDGINRIIMLTGDKKHIADRVAKELGIKEVYAECLPEDKLKILKELPVSDRPVVMVGDGINDAPALAIADVGIGLSTHGKTATSDSADVVLMSPAISRVRDLLHISRHTLAVAKQGIWIGIGLSIVCMVFAGFGFIQPVVGALLQEGIDVIVILNALRVAKIKLIS